MRQPRNIAGYALWKRIGLVLLFCVGYAFAGENRWTSHGPDEARVTKLIVHPSERATVYAATYDGGIYRSIDRGENWTAINVGMFHMTSLAIDPSEPANE